MNILVATAGATPAQDKAEYVVTIAKRLGADLVALHILNPEGANEEQQRTLASFVNAGHRAGVRVDTVAKTGDVATAISNAVEEAEAALIIMGASEGTVVSRWLSSNVSEKTTIPVVVVPYAPQLG